MGIGRKILLLAVALTLLAVTIATWGSMGSVLTALCLLMMGGALAYQRFLTNRDEDDYQMET